jgi:hypothetical protein
MRKKKPFIYFDKLTKWNIVVIAIYFIFTLFVIFNYTLGEVNAGDILIFYALLPHLVGYFFMYKALRNFTMYSICFGFAIVHVFLYFLFRGSPKLQMVKGDPSPLLLNSIVLIVLFQVLRYLSIKMQKREFVVPAKGGGKDLFDNIELSGTDYLLFVIYWASFGGLVYLAFANG